MHDKIDILTRDLESIEKKKIKFLDLKIYSN